VTAPHFLDNAEAEDAAELNALIGFDLNQPKSDAQLDAIASDICRQLAALNADRARYDEAEAAEISRIRTFYRARVAPIDLRIQQLEALGAEIAQRATFPGKSKSRKVAFGSYGSRKIAEKVSVVDQDAAINFLLGHASHAVMQVSSYKIVLPDAKQVVKDHLARTGEVAAGFEHVGESEKFFIKPEL
jgi:hypothetical protein